MSPLCKALKLFCFLAFVFAIFNVVLEICVVLDYLDASDLWAVAGIALGFAASALAIVFCVFGIQAANNPRKTERSRTWAFIAAITGLFATIASFVAWVPSVFSCGVLFAICLLGGIWSNSIIDDMKRKLAGGSSKKSDKKSKKKKK